MNLSKILEKYGLKSNRRDLDNEIETIIGRMVANARNEGKRPVTKEELFREFYRYSGFLGVKNINNFNKRFGNESSIACPDFFLKTLAIDYSRETSEPDFRLRIIKKTEHHIKTLVKTRVDRMKDETFKTIYPPYELQKMFDAKKARTMTIEQSPVYVESIVQILNNNENWGNLKEELVNELCKNYELRSR